MFVFRPRAMSEPDALQAIARHAAAVAVAIATDLAAIQEGRGSRACAGIVSGGFARVQEQARGKSGGYLQLVQAISGHRHYSAAPMVLLTRLEGSLTLAKVFVASPDAIKAYFDPSRYDPVARDALAKGMIEGLVTGCLFLIAATSHREGYLAKFAQGHISDPEKQAHRASVLTGVQALQQGYRSFDGVAPNLGEHPYAVQQGELLQWLPMPLRIAGTNAVKFNEVWVEQAVAAQVKAQMAELQAAGAMAG